MKIVPFAIILWKDKLTNCATIKVIPVILLLENLHKALVTRAFLTHPIRYFESLWTLLTGGCCSDVGLLYRHLNWDSKIESRCRQVVDIRRWSLAQVWLYFYNLTNYSQGFQWATKVNSLNNKTYLAFFGELTLSNRIAEKYTIIVIFLLQ